MRDGQFTSTLLCNSCDEDESRDETDKGNTEACALFYLFTFANLLGNIKLVTSWASDGGTQYSAFVFGNAVVRAL